MPREVDPVEGANEVGRADLQAPSAPESGGLQSNPDDPLATPPAASADAWPDTPAYYKHVAVSLLDCRDATSDGRRSRDASGHQA